MSPSFSLSLKQLLGQSVLDFGFMESAIRTLVLTLSRTGASGRALVPPGNSVSHNLELLRRLCEVRVDDSARVVWIELIDDLKALYEERNRVFHGMFYIDQQHLVLAKTKKGKGGKKDEHVAVPFDEIRLSETLLRLEARRRQIFDFLDDYSETDDGPPHAPSQDEFPSLRLRNDA